MAADELKTMLGKVLKSQGRKRFNFGFGTGKRKDGKGDGALAVAPKKIKKTDLEEDCEVAQFYDGACWSSPDGGTVYFSGKKKLSSTLVAKMMLTVKKTTGRTYEFALPTPEEENRTADLEEASENDELAEAETEGGASEATAAPEQNEVPVAPPLPSAAAAAVKARMQALLPKHLQAVQALPGERAALEQKSAAVTKAIKAREFEDAGAALDAWENAITRVLRSGAQPDVEGAVKALKAKLKALMPALQAAIQAAPHRKPELDGLLADANTHARGGKKDEALGAMGELEQLIKAVLRNPSAPAPETVPVAPPLTSRTNAEEEEQQEQEQGQQEQAPVAPPVPNGQREDQGRAEQGQADQGQEERPQEEVPPAPPPPPQGSNRADVVRRFNATGPGVRAAVARRGPELGQVQTLFAGVKTAIDQQKLPEAVAKLDELEALLAQTASQGRAQDAAQTIPVGTVALRKAMLNWKNTLTAAKAEMAKAKNLVLNDPLLTALPQGEWAQIEQGANGMDGTLSDFDSGLWEALDEAINASAPDAKQQQYRRALGLITEYEGKLSSEPIYAAIEEAYPTIKLHTLLSQGLTKLATQLRR